MFIKKGGAMKHLHFIATITVLGISFLLSGYAFAQDPIIDSKYIFEKKQKVTRTEYDFSYYVQITNPNNDIKNVTATVSSTSENTTVIDGSVNFNNVSAGAASQSIDTFTIRQDRRHKFDPTALVWKVQYELADNNNGLPPDPGEEGRLTIEGIDSDNDGVRDDVQIDIANRYPNNTNARLALRQLAKSLQKGFIAVKNNDSQVLNNISSEINAASDCISAVSERTNFDILFIENIMVNTNARSLTRIDLSAAASGKFFAVSLDNLESHCKR